MAISKLSLMGLIFLLCLTVSPISEAARGAFSTADAGARGQLFGEAFVAIADDADATRWNPAGIPSLLQTEVTFSHTNLFTYGGGYFDYASDSNSINQDFVGVAFPNLRVPIGISYFNVGTHGLIAADDRGAILDANAGYAERLLTLSAGKKVARMNRYELALGLNLNRYWVNARQDRSGFGVDGGLLITRRFFPLSSSLQVGVMRHGLTGAVGLGDDGEQGTTIPSRFDVGIAYRLLREQIVLAVGSSKTSGDSSWRYAIGGEYHLRRLYPIHLSIRGGYRSRGSRSEEGIDVSVSGWDVGGSLYINRLKLDYAYEPHSYLGDTHRMTISILENTPTEIYWRRGLQHDTMLEDEAALEAFRQLVNLNPRSAKAYHRMALIYERERRIDDAIAALERVREVDADYFAEKGLGQLIADPRDQRE
ncbi:hypothetical protein HYR99_01665 [Candidatus Poribacteria bacterium]|nr:hypothetical protein [Candidatus Poribacteria bacterium]